MALIGYAHVCPTSQSSAVQLDQLQQCHTIFFEYSSDLSSPQPRLELCLDYLCQGDTLVVTDFDCLAHSTLHLCQIAAELERKRVDLQVLNQNIDTRDAQGRSLFHLLAAIGQFETALRAERQRDGIQKAKERGVRFGQSKRLAPTQIAELQIRRQEGVPIRTLMQDYQLSKASIYRYLKLPHLTIP